MCIKKKGCHSLSRISRPPKVFEEAHRKIKAVTKIDPHKKWSPLQ